MKNLNFPLYHATSTLFIDQIREFGLGGFNPIIKLKVIELLKELEIFCDNVFAHIIFPADNSFGWKLDNISPKFRISKYEVSLITQQKTGEYSNFQHGQTYLTPSIHQAMNYSNVYGSEAISTVFKVANLLKQNGHSLKNFIQKYPQIFNLENGNFKTLILEIKNIEINYIAGEKKEDVSSVIMEIREAIEEYGTDYQNHLSQENFRLIKPIPYNKLKIVA